MDTPFTPKTHISKRIKLWAIILLIAVILASGLAMLTGGKTRLFKGDVQESGKQSLTVEHKKPTSLSTIKQGEEKELMKFTIFTNQQTTFQDINLIQQDTPEKVEDLKGSILMMSASLDASLAGGDLHVDLETSFTNEGIRLTTPAKLFIFEANETATITIKATMEDKAEIGKTIKLAIPEKGGIVGLANITPTGLPIETSLFAIVSKTGTGPFPDFGASVDLMLDQIEKAAEEAGKTAEEILQVICTNTATAKWLGSGQCEFNNNIYTNADALNTAVTINEAYKTAILAKLAGDQAKSLQGKAQGITDINELNTLKTQTENFLKTAQEKKKIIENVKINLPEEITDTVNEAVKIADEAVKNISALIANLETPPAPTETLKELCTKEHSQWYKWNEKNGICTYQGKPYSTAEDLQKAIDAGNLAELMSACLNTSGAKWIPNECTFNSQTYTNVEKLNAAVEGKPAGSDPAPTSPKLIFSVPADAPKDGNIEQGKTIEASAFELKAENNPIIITKLRLTHSSPNDTSTTADISSLSIKSSSSLPITVLPDSKFPHDYIVIPTNLTIPADTSIKFWIEAKVKATAPTNNQFKLGFLEKGNITAFAVDTPTPVEITMPPLDQTFKTFGGTFTIIAAESSNTPAGTQLTVSKPAEIAAGNITQGSSADVLKLKFQATDADITINSIKITTQGSAPVTDLQSFKLMEGANVIGSSTDIGATTLIATPSFTILKSASRELTLNVTAKSSAVKDNVYLFKIQQSTDIFADTANVLLTPMPLSSAEFKIAIAVAGAGLTPTAPTVSVTASPATSQTAGQQALFTITVNNGPGGTYNYSIDFGNGTKQDFSSTLNTASFTSDYKAEAKDYIVTASVSQTADGPLKTPLPATPLIYKITTAATTLVTFENTCKSTPNAIWTPANNNCTLNGTIYNSETSFKTAIEAVATAQAKALADLQQQLANSQNAQSTAQITALNKQIADLIALNAAKEASAKLKSIEEAAKKLELEKKKKAKTPVETPEMWGPTPTQAPVYVPPAPGAPSSETTNLQNQIAALQQQFATGQMYASAPSLGYSQKLVKAPDKSNTGPEVLVYFIAVGAANAAWWIRRKIRK